MTNIHFFFKFRPYLEVATAVVEPCEAGGASPCTVVL